MRIRANVHLDHDAYEVAVAYAAAKGLALGAAISELIRRALEAPEPSPPLLRTNQRGLLVKAKAGRVVTPEMVKKFSEGI